MDGRKRRFSNTMTSGLRGLLLGSESVVSSTDSSPGGSRRAAPCIFPRFKEHQNHSAMTTVSARVDCHSIFLTNGLQLGCYNTLSDFFFAVGIIFAKFFCIFGRWALLMKQLTNIRILGLACVPVYVFADARDFVLVCKFQQQLYFII